MSTDDTTPTDASPDDKIEALEARVAELEAMTEVDSDADDGGLSLPDLLDLGLTRRQALMAIALVGAGWTLGPAITKSISEPAAASHGGATLGTQDNPLEAIYVEDLNQTTDNIVADSVSTDDAVIKQLQGEVGLVSPSKSAGYDSITAAINDGHDEVWLMEDIQESGIPIPSPGFGEGFRLRGIGDHWVTITDSANDGTPILDADVSGHSWNVTLENIHVAGNSSSGRSIDADANANGFKLQHWNIEKCKFSAGPPILTGGIQCEWHSSACSPSATTDWAAPDGNTYTVGCAVIYQDTTWKINGGTFTNSITNDQGGENIALWLSGESISLGGQLVFNDAGASDGTNLNGTQLLCDGVENLSLNGVWFEPKASVSTDIEWTDKANDRSSTGTVVSPFIGNGQIVCGGSSRDLEIIRPNGTGTLQMDAGFAVRLVEGEGSWSLSGDRARNAIIIEGSGSGMRATQGIKGSDARRKSPIMSSAPFNPDAGDYYIDDGTNTSSGNLALRVYDGSSWVDQN